MNNDKLQPIKWQLTIETTRWILVNTVMCQLPILIMLLQGFSKKDMLYSGISYAVTLLIVANYTLEDLNFSGLRKTSLILWLLVTTAFLAIYPSIKYNELNETINKNTYYVYIIIIGISNFLALISSWEQLKNNSYSTISSKLNSKREVANQTNNSLASLQERVVINEEDY